MAEFLSRWDDESRPSFTDALKDLGLRAVLPAFVLFGVGLNGLITSLGGLFAVDIAPKKVAGAAMGLVGVFSYIGAAVQENISGSLIESGMQVIDGVRTYDFGPAIWFWIGSSIVSMVLAATLWKVRLRE